MRVRTILSAGVFAFTAVLGGAGSALADEHDESHSGGEFRICGQFAHAEDSSASWGTGCAESRWVGEAPEFEISD
ncbi:hypothetical protein [Streptomyces sp. 8P21H-1]|uniref:hypothetical protein n=1 Tax=Streptomyces sp. 8P21H-1 TaxID=2737048 RepID=UPI00156F69E3|nr:hypothetical protein [Streptomyces sp. 8P21H-1]NSL43892.1 hypothetical protein [Streptomyces sp. 8P21H-1]